MLRLVWIYGVIYLSECRGWPNKAPEPMRGVPRVFDVGFGLHIVNVGDAGFPPRMAQLFSLGHYHIMQTQAHYLFRDFSLGLLVLFSVASCHFRFHGYQFFKRGVYFVQSLLEFRKRGFIGVIAGKVSGIALAQRVKEVHLVVVAFMDSVFQHIVLSPWPNKSPEPTAVGACRSAVAVHAASRRWLSFFR